MDVGCVDLSSEGACKREQKKIIFVLGNILRKRLEKRWIINLCIDLREDKESW